jgi:hypothetical protein
MDPSTSVDRKTDIIRTAVFKYYMLYSGLKAIILALTITGTKTKERITIMNPVVKFKLGSYGL